MFWLFIVAFVFLIGLGVVQQNRIADKKSRATGFPPEMFILHGDPNTQLICPHCQTRGSVFTKPISKKVGISGGKAAGAVLTGGVSLLATGLSRKEAQTEAHCATCEATWHF